MKNIHQAEIAIADKLQHNRQGLRAPHESNKHFPQQIALAVTTILTSEHLSTVSSKSRSVLAFIVRLLDRRDVRSSVWAFKETIARNLNISESSVYRALNELVKENFIEREAQERKAHNGRLAVARLKLTERALHLIGLIEKESRQTNEATPSVKMKDGHIYTLLKADQQTQSFQKQSLDVAKKQADKLKPSGVVWKLPSEFLFLIDQKKLSVPQIFALMKIFTGHQKRLSDAIACVTEQIGRLCGRQLFAYLKTLAQTATDFAWMRREREQLAKRHAEHKAAEAEIKRWSTVKNAFKHDPATGKLYRLNLGVLEIWSLERNQFVSRSQTLNAAALRRWCSSSLVELAEEAFGRMLAENNISAEKNNLSRKIDFDGLTEIKSAQEKQALASPQAKRALPQRQASLLNNWLQQLKA